MTVLGTGVSALRAFQRQLATTGHNIANANREGYSRQRVELGTQPPQQFGNDFLGKGVKVDGVQRVHDQFLTDQVRAHTASAERWRGFHELASRIDNLLTDDSASLSPQLQRFFDAVQGLANDPASTSARQVMQSEARSLVDRFKFLDDHLRTLRDDVQQNIATRVEDINSLAESIADVNADIVRLGPDAQPNDLLDQRDQLLEKLASHVDVRTASQSDGSVNVFVGNGQALIVGTEATTLKTQRSDFDAQRTEIAISTSGGAVNVTDALTGGKLGAALDFRDEVLDPAVNGLGRVATGLAHSFNDQHQRGMDLDGNLGGKFFTAAGPDVLANTNNSGGASISATVTDESKLTTSDYRLDYDGSSYTLTRLSDNQSFTLGSFPGGSDTVDGVQLSVSSGSMASGDSFLIRPTRPGASGIGVAVSDVRKIAAASPLRTEEATDGTGTPTNTGTGEISGGRVTDASTFSGSFSTTTLTYDQANNEFDYSGGSVSYDPSTDSGTELTIAGLGIAFTVEGTPDDGDQFVLSQNTSGVGDNRNALELAGLQQSKTLDGGNASYRKAYGQMVSDVGTKTREGEISANAQDRLLQQAKDERDAVSGVNLDEEAANLVRQQQAYQAAAKVITTAETVFQSLLNAVGR